eukprot:GHVQ01023641.1.p1 GENE.GHVQ01023641.1~~GHVQ01023641.1.p1  ORF type:complete len:227 (+),score=20.50 GHVQ01023641.1:325-1005(+)
MDPWNAMSPVKTTSKVLGTRKNRKRILSPLPKKETRRKKQSKTSSAGATATAKLESGTTVSRCFLMKSEPESRYEMGLDMKFSIDDLGKCTNGTAPWDGVRNYEARNIIREMRVGDKAFFYHSNCKQPGIAGTISIVRAAYPDFTQFDPKHPHYDKCSYKEKPRWDMVDVKFHRKLERLVSLQELQSHSEGNLKDMMLLTRARLSVQRVTETEWDFIVGLAQTART